MSKASQEPRTFVYSINQDDIIVNYSRNFPSFARDNDWFSDVEPEAVNGHSIFEFISGWETRHLYEILFAHCRKGRYLGPIPFRCDSPSERRLLELHLQPLPDGHIDIMTRLVRTERRDPAPILRSDIPRSEKFIRICSMCKKIAVSDTEWVEIEEALTRLKIFEEERCPQLTHGLCPSCYRVALSDLEGVKPSVRREQKR
ncbi:hypothetical protein SAMN02746041_01258 [Desulfacinum hydrothermale DSM 13146]|uniref:Uncharacterized protein n=1 Tax=Desulfacinum hydrothermale DSM 13146 TaxID=1121390 RepID=A0A1W1XCL2_9BACT|nr:hypothetical protein [Desulfacinum hydrothermale]SMC21686.1 hypothetical protein SAMN02746041_01258 [Desulfacinum hydrothermale DSM 13146]